MVSGVPYLMMLEYTHSSGSAIFKMSIILPSGDTVNDLTDYLDIHPNIYCEVQNQSLTFLIPRSYSYRTTFSTSVETKMVVAELSEISGIELDTIYYVMTPTVTLSSLIAFTSSSQVSSFEVLPSPVSSSPRSAAQSSFPLTNIFSNLNSCYSSTSVELRSYLGQSPSKSTSQSLSPITTSSNTMSYSPSKTSGVSGNEEISKYVYSHGTSGKDLQSSMTQIQPLSCSIDNINSIVILSTNYQKMARVTSMGVELSS